MEHGWTRATWVVALVLAAGCGGGDDGAGEPGGDVPGLAGTAGTAGALAPTAGALAPTAGAAAPTAGPPAPVAGADAVPVPAAGTDASAPPVAGTDAMAGMDAPPIAGDMATAGSGATQPDLPGPEDGDPAGAVVTIPDVACGGPTAAFGLGSANFQLDGRDMIVTYPCDKREGAPMTFFLNLHGTTPVEQHFYQHGYFAIHQFAASHNIIVVTPSSVVQQWGNGDGGADEPHLLAIIDWVYANLDGPGKFDIRAMWVGGHSWGGGYTARFGCSDAIADKVKGLVMMSGGGVGGFTGAACADRVAVLISTAEGDGRMPSDQSMLAASHGCDTAQMESILQNEHTFWPDCDPGFVHANYYMLGKQHATFMDAEVVESMADWIKLSRL